MKLNKKTKNYQSWNKIFFVLIFMLGVCFSAKAQEITVNGTVTSSEDNFPIPGVAVVIKGTSTGAVTDFDGNYTINAKIGDILLFSYLGMQERSVTVKGEQLNVIMDPDVEGLDEVVVIGYGTQKKKELTGAVAQIKSEDITNVVTSDLSSAMQGQVAGVNIISNSGQPGSEAQILIRGIASVSGSNTPLYVVDGIPQEGDPGLSPNEIETIDILRDAASAAIYGTRGAAGVILITTKKGKEGTVSVKINSSYGVQEITSGLRLMNALEQNYFDIVQNRTLGTTPNDEVGTVDATRTEFGLLNDTNLIDIIFRANAPTQNHSINISGGTKELRMGFTTGFFQQDGIIINSGFKRLNSRFNVDYNKGRWNITSNVAVSFEKRDIVNTNIYNRAINYRPSQNPVTPNSTEPIISVDNGPNVNRVNGITAAFDIENVSKQRRLAFNTRVSYKLTDALTLASTFGITETFQYNKLFRPRREIIDAETGGALGNPGINSEVSNNTRLRSAYTGDLSLNYTKNLTDDHKITLTGVFSYEKYVSERFGTARLNPTAPGLDVLNIADPSTATNFSGFDYTDVYIGAIGRVQYAYKGKYLLSSSVRRDGTSKFGDGNRIGIFPSISAAWNVSDEGFWDKYKNTINNFKIRASRGTTGNSNIDPYTFSAFVTPGIDSGFDTTGNSEVLAFGVAQTAYANAGVKWETNRQTNIGLDLGFLKNKITLSAEYYVSDKDDMLFPITIPSSAGAGNNDQLVVNIGNMTNKGYELTLGYRERIGKLRLRLNTVFSTNDNEVTKLGNTTPFTLFGNGTLLTGDAENSQVTALALGHEAGAYFLRTTNGIIDTNEKLADYQLLDPTARMGDLIYKDNNGDGQISDADRVYSGSGLPEYEIGFNVNANYNNFDLSMQWYAALGHEIMNGSKANAYAQGRSRDLIYAWSEANPITTVPRYLNDESKDENFKGYSDLWLEDGSYLRLKQVTLGYSIGKKSLDKLNLSKLRFYVSAQNPITFTNYSGFDPEVGGNIQTRGLDRGRYPITATYLAGININF